MISFALLLILGPHVSLQSVINCLRVERPRILRVLKDIVVYVLSQLRQLVLDLAGLVLDIINCLLIPIPPSKP